MENTTSWGCSVVACISVAAGAYLSGHCRTVATSSDSTILPFRCHVSLYNMKCHIILYMHVRMRTHTQTNTHTCTHRYVRYVWEWLFSSTQEFGKMLRVKVGTRIFSSGPILLTNSVELSPWETISCSATQESPNILWNLKVHHRVHRKLPLIPIPSYMNPVHNHTSNFLKIHFNIILLSTPSYSYSSLYFRFCHQNLVCTFCLSHASFLTWSF